MYLDTLAVLDENGEEMLAYPILFHYLAFEKEQKRRANTQIYPNGYVMWRHDNSNMIPNNNYNNNYSNNYIDTSNLITPYNALNNDPDNNNYDSNSNNNNNYGPVDTIPTANLPPPRWNIDFTHLTYRTYKFGYVIIQYFLSSIQSTN